ncbi:hypothetical protein [Blastococcus saxobsidens]|uniref:Uncharacterized protein n=1 Tax=Blastococcus saxobsidens TaxID=138336 RepID=A0A4Q7Y3W3_9ACTN|nr:hypothetical protein [Blastococcus saxobsidens]RZU30801.1 hypothetical protein BKA19_0429 [Blastococcus saxobsidens]
MPAPGRSRAWVPWLLCTVGLALILLSLALRVGLGTSSRGSESPYFFFALPAVVAASLVGALLAARMPGNPYGWVWLAGALLLGVVGICTQLRRVDDVPYWAVVLVEDNAFRTVIALIILIFLLFPTGRLPSRRWRWLPLTTILFLLVTGGAAAFGPSRRDPVATTPWAITGEAGERWADVAEVGFVGLFLLEVAAVISLGVRFRRAGPLVRQQLKWFLLAAAIVGATILADAVDLRMGDGLWPYLNASSSVLIPIAVGIAVLRYRLFEIDRLISRTVSYAVLVAGLFAVYGLVVAVLLPRLGPLARASDLVVAAVTLAVAAVFGPVHRQVRDVVDRRFDRARYDASRAVEAFAARLRDQVDLGEVTTGLRQTVAATVAPTVVAVWLTEPSVHRSA